MKHTTTDPACLFHRAPVTWWQRRRYDRNRGRSCAPCMAQGAIDLWCPRSTCPRPCWECSR